MKNLEVNNGVSITIGGLNCDGTFVGKWENGEMVQSFTISDGELIALLNYYQNCKLGVEKSSYINEGELK